MLLISVVYWATLLFTCIGVSTAFDALAIRSPGNGGGSGGERDSPRFSNRARSRTRGLFRRSPKGIPHRSSPSCLKRCHRSGSTRSGRRTGEKTTSPSAPRVARQIGTVRPCSTAPCRATVHESFRSMMLLHWDLRRSKALCGVACAVLCYFLFKRKVCSKRRL